MAEKQEKQKEKATPKRADDDVVGKVYDSRLARRLFRYLLPYKLATAVSALAIFLKSISDVSVPFLLGVAVEPSLAPASGHPLNWLTRHLSHDVITGVTQLGFISLGALPLSWGLEFV